MVDAPAPAAYRYRFDDPDLYGLRVDASLEGAARSLPWALSQHVRISEAVLPELQRALAASADALAFDGEFTGFVYASADLNAQCIAEPDGRILILLSSSLVERLSSDEMRFVVGHEFAHAYFGHYGYPAPTQGDDERKCLELMRAAEISADRLGAASCESVDHALRAIMKTASGLGDEHLDIDLVEYLRQGAMLVGEPDDALAWSTHPPLVLRARAILRFEGIMRAALAGDDITERLRQLDDDVFVELERAMDGEDGARVALDAAFWTAASRACADGEFDAGEQERMAAIFGAERVRALANVLAAQSRRDALGLIDSRVARTQAALDGARLGVKEHFERLLAEFAGRQ